METINVNGAILTNEAISEIKVLQNPNDGVMESHLEGITLLIDFLIDIREQISDVDSVILDHCRSLKYIRKTLEAFQVS